MLNTSPPERWVLGYAGDEPRRKRRGLGRDPVRGATRCAPTKTDRSTPGKSTYLKTIRRADPKVVPYENPSASVGNNRGHAAPLRQPFRRPEGQKPVRALRHPWERTAHSRNPVAPERRHRSKTRWTSSGSRAKSSSSTRGASRQPSLK